MKPEPIPWLGGARSAPGSWWWRKNCDKGSSSPDSPVPGSPSPKPVFCAFSVTLMLTTAAPLSATRSEKSGNPVTRADAGAADVGTATVGTALLWLGLDCAAQ